MAALGIAGFLLLTIAIQFSLQIIEESPSWLDVIEGGKGERLSSVVRISVKRTERVFKFAYFSLQFQDDPCVENSEPSDNEELGVRGHPS
jgi:hypothetical protein